MTVPGDYYEVLGVPRDAGTETIKDAFRQLARRYHPDVSTEPDAERRFKEITEAYGVLSDPARRAGYDAQGSAGLAGATAEDLWAGIDLADIFGAGAAAFGSLFERLSGPAAAGPQRGQDVHLDLILSLDEVLTGGNHTVTIRRPGPCPRCAGWGRLTGQPCPACGASGTVMREQAVTIRIPPGIPEGATLRLAGHGLPGRVPGVPPGDAYLSIRTRAGPHLTRSGADLRHDLHLQAPDAALGVTAAVPVPGGQARVRVPPGTQPGSVLRVAGKGLPRYGGHGRGSLDITVVLDIPQRLSARQRQLYEQLMADEAGITGAADRSREPGAPRFGRKMTADPGLRQAAGRGLLVFASVLLLVIGVVNLAGGIAVISGSHLLTASAHSVPGGLRAMGWIMAVCGAVQLLAAAGAWAGRQAGRWFAVAVAGLTTIGQVFLIAACPLWSLPVIAAGVVALWALCAHSPVRTA